MHSLIHCVSEKPQHGNAEALSIDKESERDPAIAAVLRFSGESWPPKKASTARLTGAKQPTGDDTDGEGESRQSGYTAYDPATKGAAESLAQTSKQELRKSSAPPREAMQEFLLQCRRTSLADGYSPSELLNDEQIRAKINALIPSPAHTAQARQANEANKSQSTAVPVPTMATLKPTNRYERGQPCYALYFGPRRNKNPRWVPAVVTKVCGSRSVKVRVYPTGPVWRRHIEQLRPRYGAHEDLEVEDDFGTNDDRKGPPARDTAGEVQASANAENPPVTQERQNPPEPQDNVYDAQHPRRSTRMRRKRELYQAI